jgi:dienelactone hydrolase
MDSEIVLFHSALGLRPAVVDFAARLRAAGHRVHTPDLFDGEVFDSMEDGEKKRDLLGIPELMKRAAASVAPLGDALVFGGFSMGAAAAEFLAATRSGAKGAVLMHGVVPLELTGAVSWPGAVPVQIHYAKHDRSVDAAVVDTLTTKVRASGAGAEVHVYDGSGHLFADAGSVDYDAKSAELMIERVLAFVKACGAVPP